MLGPVTSFLSNIINVVDASVGQIPVVGFIINFLVSGLLDPFIFLFFLIGL